ncbi:non-ribosomal peptide synthetase [Flavobacterium sp. Fl-318]|uniref:Non-ribosomal peptide synthetase n=1 Tax=Flavobacterium cupriresistens TaxID=2893885 RepID=A0ABU4RE22_9FLAO|nr:MULTISPECIES: non-ribosomal peptide synthetase [unclassified Flavobacterium]MDX6189700.1 non-ribosomal peptide synthetase [Flavobacterium sp. Fl-318]UFH40894.1 amino acid adenylation domain-containing protein [Flavobacterium sp. F-323]
MTTIEQIPQKITLKNISEAFEYLQKNLMEELKLDKDELEELEDDENLYTLGLDSISMTDLTSRWKRELGIEVKNTDFLREPTLESWAAFLIEKIEEQNNPTSSGDATLQLYQNDEKHRFERFKLGEIQNAYLVGRNAELPWGGISCYGYFEMNTKDLNLNALQLAVNALVKRHEMLRVRVDENGFQKILPEMTYTLPVYKLENNPNLQNHLVSIREQMANQIMQLHNPLFDLRVSEMNNKEWRIHFGMDFIASDALSLRLFWRDLSILYSQQIENTTVKIPMPEIKASFRDYLQYVELRKKSDRYEGDKAYWLGRINNLPAPPKLPVKKQISEYGHTAKEFTHFEQTFEKEQWDKFCKHAAQKKLTPTAALMSIFSEVLSAWGAGQHFGLMLTVFERDPVHPDIDKVIGDFTHLSLLSVNCLKRTVGENAQALQWQMQEDLEHKSFSAIEVVKELNRVNPSADLFYPVVFTSALGLSKDENDLGDPSVFGEVGYSSSQTPQVWLDSQVMTKNGNMVVAWDVLNTIFPFGLAAEMFETYTNLIETAVQEISFWESTLDDLRPGQQRYLHGLVNQTQYSYPEYLLHEQILEHAKEDPNREAIVFKETSYSYQQLVEKANHISAVLQKNNIPKGARIVVQMQKSFESVAVILGIVQYGAAYIPMSHNNPQARTVEIIQQSEAHGFITDQEFELNEIQTKNFLHLKESDLTWGKIDFEQPVILPDDIAYIIFTSGSTGKPKGVVISHKAATNTILDVNKRFGVSKDDAVLGVSAYSFDLSVYDIFGILGIGGKLVIPTEEERIDPKEWKSLLIKHQITLWNSVPALFNILLDSLSDSNTIPLEKVFLSGDWIPLSTFDRMKKLLPETSLVSMGGATEASIWSNFYEVKQIKEDWSSIPYGYPLSNQEFYILDESGRPCPSFVKGKLHIAGKGLAVAYWGREDLTQQAFYVHPTLHIRLYDTGDYGQYIEEGIIEFLGRKDDQLKINGYRIEIAEIQMAFQKCNPTLDPVILPIGEKAANKKLVAYVKATVETFSESALKKQLAAYLPPYIIPDSIIPLASYPVTNNGKIDRNKLIQLATEKTVAHSEKSNAEKRLKNNQNQYGAVHPVLKVVREVFDLPELSVQDQFSELGISSIDIIRLANQLETSFLDRPAVGDMVRLDSTAELIAYYEEKDIHFEEIDSVNAQIVSGNMQAIPPQFLLYTPEQMKYLNGLKFIDKLDDRQSYKKSRVAKRKDLASNNRISLSETKTTDLPGEWRKSYRSFLDKVVSFEEFKGYLNLCSAQAMDQNHRFNYASSGGIYPVQIYLTVFKDKVENVKEGYYYFDPYSQELVLISSENVISPTQLNFNHQWLEQGAFAVHMVADMEAVYPVYQKESLKFCMLEGGLISQLLESDGAHYNIGSCQLGGYDFEQIKAYLNLSVQHFYIHTLIAGAIDFQSEKAAMQTARETLEWQKHIHILNSLVAECDQKKVQLWVEEGKLKFKAPEGALDNELLEKLKSNKTYLIAYLQSETFKEYQKRHERFDLTPIQAAFLMGRDNNFELGNVGSHYYSELKWPHLDVAKLEKVVNQIINLHDALRTVIYEDGTQRVLPGQPEYHIKISDEKPQKIRDQRSHHKYPLGQWPMFHFEVSQVNTADTILHLSVDLLLLDAWSADLLMREIIKAYQDQAVKKPNYTFKQYIADEKAWHLEHTQFIQKAETYWASKLKDMPAGPALPFKKPLSEIEQPQFKRYTFAVSDEAIAILNTKAGHYKLSATAVFATLFSKLLSHWSGGKALTLNMTLFNRLSLHPDVNEVMGDFTNVALISYFPHHDATFLNEAAAIQEQIWQAVEHRAKNGLEVLRTLNKNNPGKAVMPVVYTSLLSSESADIENNFFPKGVKEVYAVSQTPQVVIDHQIYRRGDEYLINLDVVEEAFDLQQLEEIIALYETWVHQIAKAETWEIQLHSTSLINQF